MNVNGKHHRTVWFKDGTVFLINQNLLPFEFSIFEAKNYSECCHAIQTMIVRGAPAIGATAAFAMAQAFLESRGSESYVSTARKQIENTRPTGQNLFSAVRRVYDTALRSGSPEVAACDEAQRIADEDVENCKKIGELGNQLIRDGAKILTHCNAGWLACVDYGTALSPFYVAHQRGKKFLVYVGETRPRSQGAKLTAWELKNENIAYCIFADNAGAYIMKKEKIDMVIVGADRVARNGDVANKIGTLEKAIIAKELGIPFYVAAPTSTIDGECKSGDDIPIEYRNEKELMFQTGITKGKDVETILAYPEDFNVTNPAFDVTPAKYVAGIITEKGIIGAGKVEMLLRDGSK